MPLNRRNTFAYTLKLFNTMMSKFVKRYLCLDNLDKIIEKELSLHNNESGDISKMMKGK